MKKDEKKIDELTMLEKVYEKTLIEDREKELKIRKLIDNFSGENKIDDDPEIMPPPPPDKKTIEKIREKSKNSVNSEDIKKILTVKEIMEKPIPDTGYDKPNIFLSGYLTPIIILVFNIFGFVALFMFRQTMGYFFMIALIFYAGLFTPIFLGLGGYMLIKTTIIDRNRITGALIKRVSKNFIVANFFLTQKRIIKRVCMIRPDGISFEIGDNLYTIDREECWIDEDNYPNGYWLPNMPNQLKLDIATQILSLVDGSSDKKTEVTYSSKNLKVLMKDKIFYEFHNQITPEAMKLLYVALGIIGVAFITIIVIVALKG